MSALARRPTPDLDDTIEQMDALLSGLTRDRDRRERFLLMYRTFKHELRRNLQLGRFLDVAWSEAICCRMAQLYLDAFAVYESDRDRCPQPWVLAFDRALSGRTNLLQDMLLGMNAHINYDLPLCTIDTMRLLRDVGGDDPALSPADAAELATQHMLRRRYYDFLLINQIAWESIARIQDVATRRFARLLGAAVRLDRALPPEVSRTITTRVIIDYRDRAWGHTLLLLTAADRAELETVKALTSAFALDVAALVDLLSFTPRNVPRLLRRRTILPDQLRLPPPEYLDAVVRTLVARLGQPAVGPVAERALLEYGPAIQPLLAQRLQFASDDPVAYRRLVALLGSHPTPGAAGALARELWDGPDARLAVVLPVLARIRAAGVVVPLDEARVVELLGASAREAARLARFWDDLDAGDPLLGEALRSRVVAQVCRVLRLGTLVRGPLALAGTADALEARPAAPVPADLTATLDALVPALGAVVAPILSPGPHPPATPPREPDSQADVLGRFCAEPDPWLRACALHHIAERRLHPLAGLARAALAAPEPLVRESASRACAALVTMPVDTLEGAPATMADYSTIEKVLLLKKLELFIDIPAEDLAEIAAWVEVFRFRPGQRLIARGQRGEALFVLVQGAVEVLGAGGQRLALVEPYAVLGETSILLSEPCSATCVATTDGHALRIQRPQFERLLRDYPEVTLGLLRVMARRVQVANSAREPLTGLVSRAPAPRSR